MGGAGIIRDMGGDTVIIMVRSFKDITNIIIPHFEKYPLLTKKHADYLLFKQIVDIIEEKGHLTQEGFEKIVSIKGSINLGLSDSLKVAFPDVNPVIRPDVDKEILNLINNNWISGFSSAEGCFLVSIGKSPSHKLGSSVQLVFQITQHSRDIMLMEKIVEYFGFGRVRIRGNHVDYICTKFSNISDSIIPFFLEYPIKGVKSSDFEDWRKVANLMATKSHLTLEGLEQIRQIKSGMNTGREHN